MCLKFFYGIRQKFCTFRFLQFKYVYRCLPYYRWIQIKAKNSNMSGNMSIATIFWYWKGVLHVVCHTVGARPAVSRHHSAPRQRTISHLCCNSATTWTFLKGRFNSAAHSPDLPHNDYCPCHSLFHLVSLDQVLYMLYTSPGATITLQK